MAYAILTDENGKSDCGSDGIVPLDGRWNMQSIHRNVKEYRQRFEKNFPEKFNRWKRFGIVQSLRNEPTITNPI